MFLRTSISRHSKISEKPVNHIMKIGYVASITVKMWKCENKVELKKCN